jgi:hypothetical protein
LADWGPSWVTPREIRIAQERRKVTKRMVSEVTVGFSDKFPISSEEGFA